MSYNPVKKSDYPDFLTSRCKPFLLKSKFQSKYVYRSGISFACIGKFPFLIKGGSSLMKGVYHHKCALFTIRALLSPWVGGSACLPVPFLPFSIWHQRLLLPSVGNFFHFPWCVSFCFRTAWVLPYPCWHSQLLLFKGTCPLWWLLSRVCQGRQSGCPNPSIHLIHAALQGSFCYLPETWVWFPCLTPMAGPLAPVASNALLVRLSAPCFRTPGPSSIPGGLLPGLGTNCISVFPCTLKTVHFWKWIVLPALCLWIVKVWKCH